MTQTIPDDSIDILSTPLREVRVLAALNGLELYGHERGNIEVYKALRDLGAKVYVGVNAVDNGAEVGACLRESGFDVFPLPFSNQWSWQWLKQYPLSIYEKLKAVALCSYRFRQAASHFRPTHILLGNQLTYSYLSLALAAERTPLVCRLGDCPPTDSWFNMRWWRAMMHRSRAVVCNSNYVLQTVLKHGPQTTRVIHNLAPGPLTQRYQQTEIDDRDLGKIVYVGAVAEHKGLIPLVIAFARLAKDRRELSLDIVGGSQYDSAFRSRLVDLSVDLEVEDCIRLLGYCGDPRAHYRSAALHVAPSLCEEGFANVVVEAKREGTPSVVFPSGGLSEMVRHQVDGFICRDKSDSSLEEGLRWMLSDTRRLLDMGLAAQSDYEDRFGRERFLRAWAAILLSTRALRD